MKPRGLCCGREILYTNREEYKYTSHVFLYSWNVALEKHRTSVGSSRISCHLQFWNWTDQPNSIKQKQGLKILTDIWAFSSQRWLLWMNPIGPAAVICHDCFWKQVLLWLKYRSLVNLPLPLFVFPLLLIHAHICPPLSALSVLSLSPPISPCPLAPDCTSLSPPVEWKRCQLICEQSVSSLHKRAHTKLLQSFAESF